VPQRQNGDDNYVAVIALRADRVAKTMGQQSISAGMFFVNAGMDAKGFGIRDQVVKISFRRRVEAVMACLA